VIMRKGTSLIELLAALFVIGVLSLPFAHLTTTTLRDVPRSYRAANVNTTVLNSLEQIRLDVNRSVALPDFHGGLTSNDRTLLLQLPDGLIRYELDDDKITRYVLVDSQQGTWQEEMRWSVPRAVINWQVLRDDGRAYAVELHKHIAMRTGGVIEKKFANSYVFFVGACPEPIE